MREQSGASYIAQVLKRNRTLKVLNLSDNKIDSSGLMAIAEALVGQPPRSGQLTLTLLCRSTMARLRPST
jgi:hypothetical protein